MKALALILQKLRSLRLSFLFILFVLFMVSQYLLSHTTPIVFAIKHSNIDVVRYLISKGFDVNDVNTRGESTNALSESLFVDTREKDLFKLLIDSGADPDTDDTYYARPMIMTMVAKNNTGLLKLLIARGANLNKLSQDGSSALYLATKKNNINMMKILIDAGADIDIKNHKGNTALDMAVKEKQMQSIRLLLAYGADPNISGNITPLAKALRLENIEIVQLLLESGADVNRQNAFGWSVMHLAAHQLEKGERTFYELLLKHNPNMNVQNYKKQTPFMIAVKYDTSRSIANLIKQGADINAEDENANTPLLYAAKHGNSDVVKLLINSGTDIDAKNREDGSTALIYMVKSGESEMVDFLIKKGADVDAESSSGSTALIYVSKLDVPTKKLLIKKNKDANTLNEHKIMVLMNAAAKGDIDLVRKLVKKGADLNAIDSEGNTLLMHAAKNSSKKVVEFFIINDVDVNLKNREDYSALMFAAEYASADVVSVLIESGAYVHVQDRYNRTPLSLSVRNSDKDVQKVLIENGALRNITRIVPGATPEQQAVMSSKITEARGRLAKDTTTLMKAAKLGNSEMVELLLKEGVDINATSQLNNLSALQYAIESGDIKSVKLLLENGADININYDAYGNKKRLLIDVIREKKLEIAKLLIKHGIELDMMDPNHYSAMIYAINEEYVSVVKALLEKGANIQPDEKWSFSPLGFALQSGNTEIISLLIGAGAKVESSNSPMISAVRSRYIETVKLLIDRGYDVNAMDSSERTALQYAAYYSREDIIDLLTKNGAKILNGYTGLCIAVIKHDMEKVKHYSKERTTINWSENEAQSALHKAIRTNQTEVVKVLLEAGAHAESRDHDGGSPLSHAVAEQNPEIIKLLIDAGANANYQHKWGYRLRDANNSKEIEEMLIKAGAE